MDFWQTKSLSQMTKEEWDSLCDGCAKCCLIRLQNEDTSEVVCTSLSCSLLNIETCRCKDYPQRHKIIPECIQFNKDHVKTLTWLPKTCAYRLIEEGKPLENWHPLISKDSNSVHTYQISVKGKISSEENIPDEQLEDYIIDWMD